MLTREAIFAASANFPTRAVEVPEWGGVVHVRTITAKERDSFEASTARVGKGGDLKPDLANYRGRFAALVLSDEKGKRLFTDDDAGQLGDAPAAVLDRICDAGRKLNGMDASSVEDAKGNS